MERRTSIYTHLVALIVPALTCLISLAIAGCVPFGEGFPEGWDCYTQYLEYLDWYRGVLTSGSDLFYSFGKSLGGSMVGIYGYYLASPLNLLILLFPEGTTPTFMVVVGVIKVALMGLTMSVFVSCRFDLRGCLNVALSCGYALCSYVASWLLLGFMWMDAVLWLPLVALGMYRWLTRQRRSLFLVSVAASIISCWYTGYMVCLFAIFYLPCEYFILSKGKGARAFILTYLRFGGLLLVGVLLSAFLLLPVVFAQMGGESVDFSFTLDRVFPVNKILGPQFLGAANYFSAPQMFVGTLALSGCLLFLLNRDIAPREKVTRCLLFLFVWGCAYIQAGNELWCGLRIPRGYDCRFAFILAFLLVSGAASSLSRLGGIKVRSVLSSGGVLLVVVFACHFLGMFRSDGYFVAAAAIVVVTTAFLLALVTLGQNSRVARGVVGCVMVFLAAGEMGANTSYLESEVIGGAAPVQTYSDYRASARANYQELIAQDDSWYRLEKTCSRLDYFGLEPPDSEGIVLGYSGISSYSSAPDENLFNVLSYLGYSRTDMGSANYQQPIVLSDALLGIKYVMNGDGSMWQNPYALSLGYAASDEALGALENVGTTAIVDNNKTAEGTNPFEVQNELISKLLGRDVEVFKPLPAATQTEVGDEHVSWSVDTQGKRYAYGYVNCDNVLALELTVNGNNLGEYFTWESYYVFSLGTGVNGDASGAENVVLDKAATVSLDASGSVFEGHSVELLAYYVDEDVLSQVVSELALRQLDVKEFRAGFVSGTFSSDSDTLLFTTVPYDEGWTIRVDGQEIASERALGAFTAFHVDAGAHEIEMTYSPKGFLFGVAISLVTLVGVIVFSAVSRSRKPKRNPAHANTQASGDDAVALPDMA